MNILLLIRPIGLKDFLSDGQSNSPLDRNLQNTLYSDIDCYYLKFRPRQINFASWQRERMVLDAQLIVISILCTYNQLLGNFIGHF